MPITPKVSLENLISVKLIKKYVSIEHKMLLPYSWKTSTKVCCVRSVYSAIWHRIYLRHVFISSSLLLRHLSNSHVSDFHRLNYQFANVLRASPDPSSLATQTTSGKAVPLQAWSGPEGSRKLRFPDVMTTAQDGGKVVTLTHRPPLPPANTPGTHFC
jgi:hypothetical protein